MQNTVAGIASWLGGDDPQLPEIENTPLTAPTFTGPLREGGGIFQESGATVKVKKVFGDAPLTAFELEITLTDSTYPSLPVLGFIEGGERPSEIRVYHSLWALEGTHRVRPPVINSPEVVLPGVLGRYHQALGEGQAASATGLFTRDGTAREPSGDLHGPDQPTSVNDFFRAAFAPGGIGLTYHSLVEAGPLFAAEYTCHRWGGPIPPQAGAEVWEVRGDQIRSVRIYDDIQQPKA